jgi:hypothetical protein
MKPKNMVKFKFIGDILGLSPVETVVILELLPESVYEHARRGVKISRSRLKMEGYRVSDFYHNDVMVEVEHPEFVEYHYMSIHKFDVVAAIERICEKRGFARKVTDQQKAALEAGLRGDHLLALAGEILRDLQRNDALNAWLAKWIQDRMEYHVSSDYPEDLNENPYEFVVRFHLYPLVWRVGAGVKPNTKEVKIMAARDSITPEVKFQGR